LQKNCTEVHQTLLGGILPTKGNNSAISLEMQLKEMFTTQ